MNFLDMATLACEKARQTDSDSIQFAKDCIARRDQMIYQDQLWRDSLVQVDVSAAQQVALNLFNTDNPAELKIPRIIEKVVAIRTSDQTMNVENLETYYRVSLDAFVQTGKPVAYSHLAPIVCNVTDLVPADSGTYGIVWSSNISDLNKTARIRWVDEDMEVYDRTVTLSNTGTPANVPYKQFAFVPSVADPATFAKIIRIEAFAKDDDAVGDFILGITDFTTGEGISQWASLPINQGNTVFPQYQRVILNPCNTGITAADRFDLRILGKQRHISLSFDTQEPILQNISNCLIAFAHGDLLQRKRQYGQAGVVQNEANALLEQFKTEEVTQRAQTARLIPESEQQWPDYDWQTKGDF